MLVILDYLMIDPSNKERADSVRRMFAHLAGRYDSANRWMSWGQDMKWRRQVIAIAHLNHGCSVLDIGAGTGDLALEALRRDPSIKVVGSDFTLEMMRVGKLRPNASAIQWLTSDALALPFLPECFDAVVSGYLLRNVTDVLRTLREQFRVLMPGGRMVCLDTTRPPKDVWHLPARIYLKLVIPLIGGWVAGDINTYRYLPESTVHFVSAPELSEFMKIAGFREVGYRRFMGGTMAIHWGIK